MTGACVSARFRIACLALLVAVATAVTLAQVDPATALLEKSGWDALRAGRVAAAVDAFRSALANDPQNPRLHLGAGTAAFLERRDADARAELETTLALNPRLFQARTLLGQVQYRMGDLPAAIATFETATREAPAASDIRLTLERWQREAALHDRMQHAIGDRFTVSFEGPREEALAAEAIASLDRAYWRIGALLGVFPAQPVSVVLYTTEQFRDITRSPSWAVGAYDGTIRVPVRGALERSGELDRVLAHEFTHALARTLTSRPIPTWLSEGLAAALESDDLSWAEELVRGGEPVPLRSLSSGFSGMTGVEAQVAYATSALAVRRILDAAGGAAVANLLRDIGAGVDFDAAFLHRVQHPVPDFQQ